LKYHRICKKCLCHEYLEEKRVFNEIENIQKDEYEDLKKNIEEQK